MDDQHSSRDAARRIVAEVLAAREQAAAPPPDPTGSDLASPVALEPEPVEREPLPPDPAEPAERETVRSDPPEPVASAAAQTDEADQAGSSRRRARELVAEVLAARAAPHDPAPSSVAPAPDPTPATVGPHAAAALDAPRAVASSPPAVDASAVVADHEPSTATASAAGEAEVEQVDPSRVRARELVAAALADAEARAAAAEEERRASADRARERAAREAERRRRVATEQRAASRRRPEGGPTGEPDDGASPQGEDRPRTPTRPLTIAELAAAGAQGDPEATTELDGDGGGAPDPEPTVQLPARDEAEVPPPAARRDEAGPGAEDVGPDATQAFEPDDLAARFPPTGDAGAGPEPAVEAAGVPGAAGGSATDLLAPEDDAAGSTAARPGALATRGRTPTPRDVPVASPPALEASVAVPEAQVRPRHTGRWLLTSILGAVALAVLFPMAVDALRALVQL